MYLCIVNKIGAWCNGNTRVFGTLIPSSNLGVPTILITMIIEERTKKATKLLLRFLKQKNLLVEFKKDFNPNVKLKSLNIICYDEHISLEELIQIRLNRCKFSKSYILESLIDKILYFRAAKYKDWSKIDDEWRKFYRINKTFLNLCNIYIYMFASIALWLVRLPSKQRMRVRFSLFAQKKIQ